MENPLIRMRGLQDDSVEGAQKISSEVASAGVDHDFLYASIFGVLGVACAIWFSISIRGFLDIPNFGTAGVIAAAAVCLASLMIMQSILVVSRFWNIVLVAAQSAAVLFSFYVGISGWFIAAAALFFAFIVRGYIAARSTFDEGMQIRFFKYASAFDASFFTAFTVFAAVFTIGLYQAAGGVPQSTFELIFKGAERPISYALNFPVTVNTKVHDAVSEYVRKQLLNQAQFAALSVAQQGAAEQLTTQGVLDRIGEQVGIPVAPNETIGEYAYRILQLGLDKVNTLGLGAPAALLALLLAAFSLRSILIIVKLPVLALTYLLYTLLFSVGVISIGSESRPKEILLIK